MHFAWKNFLTMHFAYMQQCIACMQCILCHNHASTLLVLVAVFTKTPSSTLSDLISSLKSKNYQIQHKIVPRYNKNTEDKSVFAPVRKVRAVGSTLVTPTPKNVSNVSGLDSKNKKSNNDPLNHRYNEPKTDLPEDISSEEPRDPEEKQYCFETCNSNVNKCAAAKICPDKYIQIKPPISNLTAHQKAAKMKHNTGKAYA